MSDSSNDRRRKGRGWRIGILILILIVTVVGIAGYWLRLTMGAPLYEPGMVRAGRNPGAPLDPPAQPEGAAAASEWIVEDGITLHRSSGGEGPPVLFVHGGPGIPLLEAPPGMRALEDSFIDWFSVVGPPDVVVPRFRRLARIGLDLAIVVPGAADAVRGVSAQSIQRFGKEILPALRA